MTKSGKEAWERLQAMHTEATEQGKGIQDKVALVLTDLEMPEMDGFTLTRNIKQDPRFAGLPVIIHSSLTGTTNESHVKSVGRRRLRGQVCRRRAGRDHQTGSEPHEVAPAQGRQAGHCWRCAPLCRDYTVACAPPTRSGSHCVLPTRQPTHHRRLLTMNAPLPARALESVTLDDKYALDHGRAFMSGVQALVQAAHAAARARPAPQARTRRASSAATAARPLGGYDQALVASAEAPEGAPHRVPARRERGAGRHRRVGHPAARLCTARQQQVRRRVWHLVRQRPGRGPLLRRVQARQHGWHHAVGRRDRRGGRRPHRQELHRGAPERPHLQGLRTARVLPGQCAGDSGLGPARLRHEPLFRRVGRHEDHPGNCRVQRHRQ